MIHVLLAAWNESIAIPRLVKKFEAEFNHAGEYTLWIYDDGSSDETGVVASALAENYPVKVLTHKHNQGLGQTLIDGLNHLAELSAADDVVITMDCDDTHEPKYLIPALAKLRSGFDVVILSRFCEGAGQEGLAWHKTILSAGAGIFLKVLFPIRGVQEYSCNFRVFRADLLKRAIATFKDDFISLPHLGFVAAPEILIKFRMLQAKITESPFILRYDQKPTPSTNDSIQTIKGYFALVQKWWLRKLPT
ncbi:MAG: dolichol-phosphate mannosyltransferase [Candidatus Omnitrophota bacterium]